MYGSRREVVVQQHEGCHSKYWNDYKIDVTGLVVLVDLPGVKIIVLSQVLHQVVQIVQKAPESFVISTRLSKS